MADDERNSKRRKLLKKVSTVLESYRGEKSGQSLTDVCLTLVRFDLCREQVHAQLREQLFPSTLTKSELLDILVDACHDNEVHL
jgi:hypothetical protein